MSAQHLGTGTGQACPALHSMGWFLRCPHRIVLACKHEWVPALQVHHIWLCPCLQKCSQGVQVPSLGSCMHSSLPVLGALQRQGCVNSASSDVDLVAF
jgi:hypothetical protein